jgi:hypothetical protein
MWEEIFERLEKEKNQKKGTFSNFPEILNSEFLNMRDIQKLSKEDLFNLSKSIKIPLGLMLR